MTSAAPSRVVYTALLGGYEELFDQPMARESSVPFICFTDDPSLRSDDWQVEVVEPLLGADSIRSSRALKITGHPSLREFDETLWIDNRVRLVTEPTELLDEWLAGGDIAVPGHSFRADVVTEFQAVLMSGLDEAARLYEQLTHYSQLAPELLQAPVPWTGILARRRTPAVEAGLQQWFRHVLRYSRRDQLSFVQAMHETKTDWISVELSNHESQWHEWRWPVGRSTRLPAFRLAESLQPPVAALGELRLSFEQRVAELTAALEGRDGTISQMDDRIVELEALRGADLAELGRLRSRLRRARRKKRLAQQQVQRATAKRPLLRRMPPRDPDGG